MAQKSNRQVLTEGFIKQNPVFVQFLGMCSTLALTVNLTNAIGMGLGVIFVLIMSNVVISLIRKWIPDAVRIPVFIVVIAALVTVLEMFLNAYVPALAASLGTFLALITVNCIILGRAEAFASKHGPLKSALDGLGMGIGYTLALACMALIRGILGNGGIELFSLKVTFIPEAYRIGALTSQIGAFIVLGVLVSQINKIKNHVAEKREKEALLAATGAKPEVVKEEIKEEPKAEVVEEKKAAPKKAPAKKAPAKKAEPAKKAAPKKPAAQKAKSEVSE